MIVILAALAIGSVVTLTASPSVGAVSERVQPTGSRFADDKPGQKTPRGAGIGRGKKLKPPTTPDLRPTPLPDSPPPHTPDAGLTPTADLTPPQLPNLASNPEPASLLLIGTGLLAARAFRRRKPRG